ncbi:MAG: peptidoglycan DD-metalloendopeptidase family protein [Phototrophicaceae bacterium]
MSQQALKLKVIGIPHIPSVTEINARPDASTIGDVVFKVAVGTSDVLIIDAKEDLQKRDLNGKVYQWFQAQFPQGVAWVRDDLVEIWGDGTTIGYPVLGSPIKAHLIVRQANTIPHGAETQTPTTSSEVTTAVEVTAPADTTVQVTVTPNDPTQAPTTVEITTAPDTSTEVSSAPATPQPAIAVAMTSFPAKLRSGPSTSNPQVTTMTVGESAKVLDTAQDATGKSLYWVKVDYKGQQGWTREDLVRLSGDFPPFGLNASDKYPSPAPKSTWIRGWDMDGTIWNTGKHDGWDHAGIKGNPLLAGPKGGVVYLKKLCAKCGDEGFSTLERGLQLYDSSVYTDPAWNGGYGHYVIVAYENSKLPASTQAYLTSQGMAGQHIFVMYAHCQKLLVETGDILSPNQQIAELGNSGNSSGAHLHLEVRISPTMQPSSWAAIKNAGLRSPGILFLR